MSKLLAVLFAGMFALASAVAMAQVPSGDKTATPTPTPEERAKMKAEHDAAEAAAAKMTPEQKAAAKKAKRAKKHKELSQIEKHGNPNAVAKAESTRKSADATKNDPKALQTNAEHQKALKTQSNDPPGHYPTPPATK